MLQLNIGSLLLNHTLYVTEERFLTPSQMGVMWLEVLSLFVA